jgi:GxxExxY protein
MAVLEKYQDLQSDVDNLSKQVVDSIFKVHQAFGPGFLEKVYEECLCMEFSDRKIPFQRQAPLRLEYNGREVATDFRLDMVVDNKILIELKAVEQIHPVHEAQIYSYLKMSGLPMAFLVNFNVPLIKDGLKRYVPKNLRAFGSSR